MALGDLSDDGDSVLMATTDGAAVWVPVPRDIVHVVTSLMRTVRHLVKSRSKQKADNRRRASEYNLFVSRRLREIAVVHPAMPPTERLILVCREWKLQKVLAPNDSPRKNDIRKSLMAVT